MTKRKTKDRERDFLTMLRSFSVAYRDNGDDVIEMMTDEERAPLEAIPIPLTKARRALELYLSALPLGRIASGSGLSLEDVKRVLRITSKPCVRHGARPFGDVTMITDDVALCRQCRIKLDV